MYWQEIRSTELKTLLTKSSIGLICDFDGTLSPIVQDRERAQLAPGNRELLRQLQKHLRLVALVSGRAVADLSARVGLSGLIYIGNHGLERLIDNQIVYPPEVAAYRPAIKTALDAIRLEKEMVLEDKNVTISIHYRQAADQEAIQTIYSPILQSLADEHGLHFSQGRMVFELRPPLEINKGTALASLVTQYGLDGLVFIGDDTTDADAMRTARQLREQQTCYSVNLAVESEEMPAILHDYADAFVAGTSGVTAFLAWFLDALSAS